MDELTPYDFMTARGSTTLADNTSETAQRTLVDWVSASFELTSSMHKVFKLIGITNLLNVAEKKGSRYEYAGYNHTYQIGLIELMSHKTNTKWLVNLSGEGCRQYELITGTNIINLLEHLKKLNATFNRIDIAIDDFENIFSTDLIRKAVYEKRCVSKIQDWGNNQKGKISNGNDSLTMDSFYIGSRSSRYFLNIYDKKLEREMKGKTEDIISDTWTRTEIRFAYEYAQKFVNHILNEPEKLGLYVKEFLNDKFQFLTTAALKKDTNKSRLVKDKKNITRWWKSYLGKVGKLKISVDKPERILYDTMHWHTRQVATSLAQMYLYYDKDFNKYIEELKNEGLDKMQPKHELMVANQKLLDKLGTDKDPNYINLNYGAKIKKETPEGSK